MEKSIYVVLSMTQDECSICNRAFYNYENAWKYLKEKENETGCSFRILHLIFEDEAP